MRAAPPPPPSLLRQIRIGGHYTKKFGLISSRIPMTSVSPRATRLCAKHRAFQNGKCRENAIRTPPLIFWELMRRSDGLARAEEGAGEESARASAFFFWRGAQLEKTSIK